jgi:hypothetical protein
MPYYTLCHRCRNRKIVATFLASLRCETADYTHPHEYSKEKSAAVDAQTGNYQLSERFFLSRFIEGGINDTENTSGEYKQKSETKCYDQQDATQYDFGEKPEQSCRSASLNQLPDSRKKNAIIAASA